jgi:hypothetical protein
MSLFKMFQNEIIADFGYISYNDLSLYCKIKGADISENETEISVKNKKLFKQFLLSYMDTNFKFGSFKRNAVTDCDNTNTFLCYYHCAFSSEILSLMPKKFYADVKIILQDAIERSEEENGIKKLSKNKT